MERSCFESRNFVFKTINRKREEDQSQNSFGGWGERYGNEFNRDVFLSLEMVLFFCSLINQAVPASPFNRGKGEQRPRARECERRLEEHFARVFITLVWQGFDSSFNRPSFLLMSHSERCFPLAAVLQSLSLSSNGNLHLGSHG